MRVIPNQATDKAVAAFSVREPLGLQWDDELLREEVILAPGILPVGSGVVLDSSERQVPFQLDNVKTDAQHRWVRQADLYVLCDLPPFEERSFSLYAGSSSEKAEAVRVEDLPDSLVLSNGTISVRCAAGFGGPCMADEAPAPVQEIRGSDGVWRGRGFFISDVGGRNREGRLVQDVQLVDEFAIRKVTLTASEGEAFNGRLLQMKQRVTATGPLFAECEMQYLFEQGIYSVRVRLVAGRSYAEVAESSDLPPGGAFLFSLHHNLFPDTGITNYLGQLNSYVFGRTDELRYGENRHLGTIPSHNLENFREIWYGAYDVDGPVEDLLGAFRLRGGNWSRGARIGIYEDTGPDLLLRMDLGERAREWGLFAINKHDRCELARLLPAMELWPYVFDPVTGGGSNMDGDGVERLRGRWRRDNRPHYTVHLMKVKADESPLEDLRRQCLDWEDRPDASRPLLWDAGTLKTRSCLTEVQAQLEQVRISSAAEEPGGKLTWSDYHLLINRALISLIDDDGSLARSVRRYILCFTTRLVSDFTVLGGNSPTGHGAYNVGNQLKWLCWMYDLTARALLEPAQERAIRANLAYLAYKLADVNYFPYDRPEGATNWNGSRFKALAVFAMCFPDHPVSGTWLKHGIDQFKRELDEGVFESGAYIESTGYQQSVMDPEFAYLLRTRSGFDPYSSPRYRAMFRFFVQMQTPRCPIFQRRSLPAVGDVTWDQKTPFDVLEKALGGVADYDPELAGEMRWTIDHGTSPEAEDLRSRSLLDLLTRAPQIVQPRRPDLRSAPLDGFGAVLRSGFDTPDEMYLALKCGESWGHYHSDENSFTLFALGAPLALDSGKALYGTDLHRRMCSVWAHNTLVVNGQDQSGRRGRLVEFESSESADYVVADAAEAVSSGLFRRHILLVKKGYIVVFDEIGPSDEGEFILNCLADGVDVTGCSMLVRGSFGVNLRVLALTPNTIDVKIGEMFVHAYGTQKSLRVRGSGSFLTVLAPFRAGAEAPVVSLRNADGWFRVARDGWTDEVLVTPEGARLKRFSGGTVTSEESFS